MNPTTVLTSSGSRSRATAYAAGLQGLLVDGLAAGAEVCARAQRGALPGLQVHDVVADGAAVQRPAGLVGLPQQRRCRPRSRSWRPRCRRSTGTPGRPGHPCSISSMVVVTWDSTQDWVGISKRCRISSSRCSRSAVAAGESVAGLMPITASPQPSSRPSRVAAAMPRGSSVGWLGCSRVASRAGQADGGAERRDHPAPPGDGDQVLVPHDLADRGDHLRGQAGRERPAASRRAVGPRRPRPAASPAGRRPSGARPRANACAVVGVDDQPGDLVGLVRHHQLFEERRQRRRRPAPTAPRHVRHRTSAAQPASSSPERSGVALAIRSTRPSKV